MTRDDGLGGFAAVNGADMFFECRGEGEPVLFIHAGVADSRMWDSQFAALSSAHRVIRCDLRGFGRTLMPSGTFAHFDDIAGLLDHLNVDAVNIVGASFGGAVALDFALAHPERVAALVLAAPALGGYEFASAQVLDFFAAEEGALERGDVAAAAELNLAMWVDGFNRDPRTVNPELRRRIGEMQLGIFSQPEAGAVTERELEPPAAGRLHTIKTPILVLVGDKDAREFQAIARLIAGSGEHARLVVIPGVGHLLSMEQPDEFTRLVSEFLAAR